MKPCIEIAEVKDAQVLTSVSIAAFHTDFMIAGRSSKGGPPGYDSVEFHKQMIKESTKFFKILVNQNIVGGFWFCQNQPDEAYLYRIFIDPEYHRKNLGLFCFNFLFKAFPNIETWTLKVPIWNTRTPPFYQKIGFGIVDQSDRFLFFERRIKI